MDYKRTYTRAELTGAHCGLCGSQTTFVEHKHDEKCPLADDSVTAVAVVKYRHGIVLRLHQCRWWWTSPSQMEYHIENLPGRYKMSDKPGNVIVSRPRLSDIRHWIALNQGRL